MIIKEETRRILKEQIQKNSIEFQYLVSIDYPYKVSNLNKVLLDNNHLCKTIRKFYKDDIRIWIFNEKHTDIESAHYMGWHKHLLVEDASITRWMNPTNNMIRFMDRIDSSISNAIQTKQPITKWMKAKLLAKCIRDMNRSVPNGYVGTDIQLIENEKGGVNGCIDYLTKQVGKFLPVHYLVDPSSKGIDHRPLVELGISNASDGSIPTKYEPRYKGALDRFSRAL